jgi:hypothetical protein
MNSQEVDIETRLMVTDISLQVAATMINSLDRKLEMLIKENRER